MHKAFDYLGINNRALIIHGSSFPNEVINDKKNINLEYYIASPKNKNNYIGSPYFNDEFIDFVSLNGFNSIQLGPTGKLNKFDNSPYHSSVNAKNELFIDYGKLKTSEYAKLLSDDDLNSIKLLQRKNNVNYEMTQFNEAQKLSNTVLKKAYKTFINKLKDNEPSALSLNKEFQNFKKENKDWLEKDSIFRILSDINGTDDFSKWENELDKNLISLLENDDPVAKFRYNQIKSAPENKVKINEYKFGQFLAYKQEKEDKEIRQQKDFKYIGDMLVGFSYSDEWSNPSAFLTDWRVGAENGGQNNGPQLWNIPVLNPDKLFNEDGSLGIAGVVLKNKISKTLEGSENLRVDNVMGLVDPFIYKASAVKTDKTIDYYNCGYMSNLSEVDTKKNYPKIMHDIVLPTLKEHGINPQDVVWEDLGPQTQTFREVFYDGIYEGKTFEEEKLNGIMYSIGMQMEKNKHYQYSFLSTHDNEPSVRFLNQGWIYDNEGWNPMYLAGYLKPPYNEEQAKLSSDFCKEIENNPTTRLKAKYAELLRGTPNIQFSFTDFYGIDKTYNHAGIENEDNWKLRLNSDYQDTYYKNLEKEDSMAINMPEILELAVNSKKGLEIMHNELTQDEIGEVEELQSNLTHWKSVLKDPEE